MRPISLSNFLNKVILMVLRNRLEHLFPTLILTNQSGFVKRRSITESFLLNQEIVVDIWKKGKLANIN